MGWTIPEYPRHVVNESGYILRDNKANNNIAKDAALIIINNWRTCHNFPLNTFQVRLRKKAKEVDSNSLVVQRIKRLASIKNKLERFPEMKLTQMQDIGGCRAILKDVDKVDKLVAIYKNRQSRGMKHKLSKEDDYIKLPKKSGYRGIHLIYKYESDKNTSYKDLKIEIQIRSLLQHAWATAVETVDTFTSQMLKTGDGQKDWFRFFALMSSVMALKEGTPLIPDTPTDFDALRKEIIDLEKKLGVDAHLSAFRSSLKVLEDQPHPSLIGAHYYLLQLNITDRRFSIFTFKSNELHKASAKYLEIEKNANASTKKIDAVLVSADSMEALRLAFPNYYLDTDLFLQAVKEITQLGQLSLPF